MILIIIYLKKIIYDLYNKLDYIKKTMSINIP
jgi:hypothetical protein